MTNHDHMFAPAATSRRNMFPQPKHSNSRGNPIFQLRKNIYIFFLKNTISQILKIKRRHFQQKKNTNPDATLT